jgi:hypothetical protein
VCSLGEGVVNWVKLRPLHRLALVHWLRLRASFLPNEICVTMFDMIRLQFIVVGFFSVGFLKNVLCRYDSSA